MASRELQLLRIAILSSPNFIISSTFGNFVSLDLDLSGTSLLLISLLTNGSCASDNWVISSEPLGVRPNMALAGSHIVVNLLVACLFSFHPSTASSPEDFDGGDIEHQAPPLSPRLTMNCIAHLVKWVAVDIGSAFHLLLIYLVFLSIYFCIAFGFYISCRYICWCISGFGSDIFRGFYISCQYIFDVSSEMSWFSFPNIWNVFS